MTGEDKLMIEPPTSGRMWRTSACEPQIADLNPAPSILSTVSSVTDSSGSYFKKAALLMTASMRPRRFAKSAAMAANASRFETSHVNPSASPPAALTFAAVSAALAPSMSATPTTAPQRARCKAADLPSPRPAPVISTTRSERSGSTSLAIDNFPQPAQHQDQCKRADCILGGEHMRLESGLRAPVLAGLCAALLVA